MTHLKKLFLLAALLTASLGITGCASTLTLISPKHSEVVVTGKRTGDFQRYDYRYTVHANRIVLERIPLCNEMVKSMRIEKKRQIGYGPALLEMPLFGLGLIDIATARAISEASETVSPLDEQATGQLLTCGSAEPAAGEVLILESRDHGIYRQVITDENGAVDLEKVLAGRDRPVSLTVRLRTDQRKDFTFTCVLPVYSRVDESPRRSGT